MSSQASQISSDESMKDCLSETELRPVDAELHDDDSQISLHSCNSSETLKQWTMHYPVTACCQSAAGATSSKRRRSRKKRSRRRSSDADTSDDDMMIYVGSNGQVNCCKKVCCPRKPCTLVCLHLSLFPFIVTAYDDAGTCIAKVWATSRSLGTLTHLFSLLVF